MNRSGKNGVRRRGRRLCVARKSGRPSCLYHEATAMRMRPFADGVQGFPRMVRDIARQLGKQVTLKLVGETTPVDRDILAQLEAPLTH